MALPTYLQLVNDVLVRMREPEVSSVSENVLSKLVGRLVNDAKRQVEDAYNWNALTATVTAVTDPNVFNYGLTGVGGRFKVIDVYNATGKVQMSPATTEIMNSEFLTAAAPPTGRVQYYNFNGITSVGDTQVDLYPIPDSVQTILFNLYVPQDRLVNDGDTMYVPEEPVILGAFARALVERGEDGGLPSSEAYALYRSSLADHIAIEASRYVEEQSWEAI